MIIPAIGLGTWQGQFGSLHPQELIDAIAQTLRDGCRLLDTAQYYGVEAEVGEAIRKSEVQRKDLFIVTKYWGTHHSDPASALQISLDALGLDYVDLFLMHWPTSMDKDGTAQAYPGRPPYWEAWNNLEQVLGAKCRSIGVCNFTQKTLARLLERATIVPAVNQFELHALNPGLHLVPYCQERGIHVMGYSTLGSERHGRVENPVLTNPLIQELARKYDCTPAVIALSWAAQRGVTIIPKSCRIDRMRSNAKLVHLASAEVFSINEVHATAGTMRLADVTQGLLREMPGKGSTILGWTPQDFGWEDDTGVWLT